ncbi:MAG: 23S rRNA (uridine(2552)-2'-O)-methyltransferase [Candidatus Binatia bacterium]|nr:MAG: 23S rRNA (uridine(2552)-2'-O)-methyltransferase [Candidatus Binatia bacterium]
MRYEPKDSFYRKAKSRGYRSRAAYKLLELDRRYRILRPGDVVVDLGAWPGGWLRIAAERVGEKGRVVGVDRTPIEPLPFPWVSVVTGDILDENVRERLRELLGGDADVLLSDLSPRLSGVRDRDEEAMLELVRAALEVADRMLRRGGRGVFKLFTGSAQAEGVRALRERFSRVSTTRPEATRRGSSELYAVAFGFRR